MGRCQSSIQPKSTCYQWALLLRKSFWNPCRYYSEKSVPYKLVDSACQHRWWRLYTNEKPERSIDYFKTAKKKTQRYDLWKIFGRIYFWRGWGCKNLPDGSEKPKKCTHSGEGDAGDHILRRGGEQWVQGGRCEGRGVCGADTQKHARCRYQTDDSCKDNRFDVWWKVIAIK